MANKKVSQLTSKPSVLVTDLFPIADPSTGQLFKTTISDLGTAIGSGVSSVNTLVGAVVLDTDDIQELASPTNKYFTDTRARAALSASSPLVYNSGTGAFSIPAATTSVNGYLTSTDWTTFNAKQAALSGTGFVKISGTTISYDNSTYLTTSAAASTYLALAGGTLTGALNGTSANFSGDLTLTGTNPRFYLTDSDNNPDYFISNTDGTFTIYDVTNSVSRLTINSTTATLGANLTATSLIKSGGTSAQFLKADGSVDSSTYALDSAVVKLTGTQTVAGVKTFSNQPVFNDTIMQKNTASGTVLFGGYTTLWTTDSAFTALVGTATSTTIGFSLLYDTSGQRSYTMPTANGTLALTSQLSSYLPLSGGTLTGALSGTSATFSGNIRGAKLSLGTATTTYPINVEDGTQSNSYFTLFNTIGTAGATAGLRFGIANGTLTTGGAAEIVARGLTASDAAMDLKVMYNYSLVNALTLGSNGAATFSSSVQTTNIGINFAPQTDRLFVYNGSGTNVLITAQQDGTGDLIRLNGNSGANRFVVQQGGNVGIGTTSPLNALDVRQANAAMGDYQTIQAFSTNSAGINLGGGISLGGYFTGTSSIAQFGSIVGKKENSTSGNYDGYLAFGTNAQATGVVERMRITSAGLIFMNNLGGYSASYADVRYDTTSKELFYQTSSQRYKDNITSLDDSLSKIDRLRPVRYRDIQTQKYNCGLIAEEVIDVIPEVVFKKQVEGFDELQIEGINYSDFTPFLIKAIKELKAELDALKAKN